MNRLLFFGIVCLLYKQNVCAQFISLNDKAKYSVGYEMSYRLEEGKSQLVDEICVLDVGSRVSCFHSRKEDRASEILDSIGRNGISPYATGELLRERGYKGARMSSKVVKNYPQKGNLLYEISVLKSFHCEEPMPKMDWKFIKGDTTICGYACKKATSSFRGRHWTAWYAPKIPISDGPWKLHGLPGLILCAYEDKGDFRFLCNEIRNGDNSEIKMWDKKSQKCSLSKIIELQRLSIEDRTRLSETVMGLRMRVYDNKGKLETDEGRKACLIEVLPNDKKKK